MILVVGGTGFIGKNLLTTLHKQGRETYTVSRQPNRSFIETHAPSIHIITLEQLFADPVSALFGCEAVVYLASNSTPGANLDAQWKEASSTIEPLMRLATVVAKHSHAHFVYLSSGGTIYGQCDALKISEDAPLNPISPYGIGKKMSEAFVEYMAASSGLRFTILRPSNPVGLWQDNRSQGVVGALVRAARDNKTFSLVGDGTSIRDYFSVADLVQAILCVIDQPQNSVGQIWNVGSGVGTSVSELLAMAGEIFGRPIQVEQLPARKSDVDRVVLDTRRIQAAAGWRASRSLHEILEEVWR